jgi:alkylation response protein AidB-like acyl-CoA dehydrogenase
MRRDSSASGWGYLPLAGGVPAAHRRSRGVRVARIYAGTSEVRKVIIAKSLDL